MTEDITQTTIRFAATDGWKLEADIYTSPSPKIAVLISAGTGFPRQFYTGLAMYLARQGAVVLTYDYRGLGDQRARIWPDPGSTTLTGDGLTHPPP